MTDVCAIIAENLVV